MATIPHRKIVGVLTVAAGIAFSSGASADDASAVDTRGLVLGARVSGGLYVGSVNATWNADGFIADGLTLRSAETGEIWLTVGYRVSPRIVLGAYGALGVASLNVTRVDAGDSSKGGTLARVGGTAHFHLRPDAALDPWAGVGIGFETIGDLGPPATREDADHWSGVELRAEGGADFLFPSTCADGLAPCRRRFGVGPWGAVTLGTLPWFSHHQGAHIDAGSDYSPTTDNAGIHVEVLLGVAGHYDLFAR